MEIHFLSGYTVGEKLPIHFILKAERGGRIEKTELASFPKPHVYTVQRNAWMSSAGWDVYLKDVLGYPDTTSSPNV